MEPRYFLVRLAGFALLILLLGDLLYMHSLPQNNTGIGGMLPVMNILNCGDGGAKNAPAETPAKNASAALAPVSKETVPIMFLATELSPFVIVCLKTARKYNQEVPIYMVTSEHSVKPDGPMIDLLGIPNVHVKVIERYLGAGSDSALFHERYIHQSVTAVPFERFCFQRFMVLRDIAKEEGVRRFLHMDYDIALFTDTATFSQFDVDLVALNTHSTFFSLWKMPLLQRFCDYMLQFYVRPQAEIAADWDQYGQHFNETFIQFSDMFMLYSFLDKHKDSVSTKFLVFDKGDFTPDYLQYWAMVNLQNFIGWDCLQDDFNKNVKWGRNDRGMLVPIANGTTLQGIHWQGFMCKQIAPLIMGPILTDEGKKSLRLY